MEAHDRSRVANTARLQRISRLGMVRTTRAHLALSRRPDFVARLGEGLEAVRSVLGQQLGGAVAAVAKVGPCAVGLEEGLGRSCGFALLELSAVGGVAVLEVELPFLVAVLERLSGGGVHPAPATTLTRVEEAAFAFLCLVGLGELRGRDGFQLLEPRLRSVHARRSEVLSGLDVKARYVPVELALEVEGVKGAGRLLVPAEALQAALARVPPRALGAVAPEVLAAGLWCRAFAGNSRLTRAEARTLSPGDVVLFDDVRLAEGRLGGALRLCAPGFELRGVLGPGGFLPQGAVSALSQEYSVISEPVNEEVAAALPVDVEVELTRLRLSLADLAGIKPGALLPLHINVTEPVLLRVGDRAVARAELVEIDGEVGARILALLP